MLTVSDGRFSKTISAQRIMKVTQAAHHDAASGTASPPAEDPKYMGPLDWFTDHVFCGGVKTAVLARFDEIGRTTALLKTELQKNAVERNQQCIEDCQQQIHRAQSYLNYVISGNTLCVAYPAAAAQTQSGFLIIRNTTSRLPTGISLDRPTTDTLTVPEVPTGAALFNCDAPESIQPADLTQIRTSGAFLCAGRLVTVRFCKNNEPVILRSASNLAQMQEQLEVQKRLTSVWFANAVRQQLDRLDLAPAIDATLQLHPLFLHQGTELDACIETATTNAEWRRFAQFIQTQFSDSIEHMQARIMNPYLAVSTELSRLSLIENPGVAEWRRLKACQARLTDQLLKREKLNRNVMRLKSELNDLTHLITFSTEPQMTAIFRQRIIHFQAHIAEFSRSAMGHNEVAALNAVLDAQQVFLRVFGPEKIALCYRLLAPPDTPITLRYGIVPPVGRVFQKSLILLLMDPAKPLHEVMAMMGNLAHKNERLCQIKISQKGLAEKIERNMRLCIFSETGDLYRAGLDPDFGISLYTQATYARIASLLKMRQDLLDPAKNFRKDELQAMRQSILEHLRHIIAEDQLIIDQAPGDFALSSAELH